MKKGIAVLGAIIFLAILTTIVLSTLFYFKLPVKPQEVVLDKTQNKNITNLNDSDKRVVDTKAWTESQLEYRKSNGEAIRFTLKHPAGWREYSASKGQINGISSNSNVNQQTSIPEKNEVRVSGSIEDVGTIDSYIKSPTSGNRYLVMDGHQAMVSRDNQTFKKGENTGKILVFLYYIMSDLKINEGKTDGFELLCNYIQDDKYENEALCDAIANSIKFQN